MALEGMKFLSGGDVPDSHDLSSPRGDCAAAVGTDRNAEDRAGVALELADDLAGRQVPERDRSVDAGGDEV